MLLISSFCIPAFFKTLLKHKAKNPRQQTLFEPADAELAFTTFFTGLIAFDDSTNIALSGMLIWRMFTYYLLIFYGMIMYALFERGNRNEDRTIY